MSLRRHLTFANVASATALALVLGGGAAVAAGLAPNSVGSVQIKNNAVTGKDVKESSLRTVPSVATVVVDKRVKARLGAAPVTVHRSGPFTLTLRCEFREQNYNPVTAVLEIRTSEDRAALAKDPESYFDVDFDVADGPVLIGQAGSGSAASVHFSAISPDHELLTGSGYVSSRLHGSYGCAAQLTFIG